MKKEGKIGRLALTNTHAGSLQSCSTLCDPMDCSPPDSSVHGISQATILEWGCHFLVQEIFPTQGSNQHLLQWQVDSLLPIHQGSPGPRILISNKHGRVILTYTSHPDGTGEDEINRGKDVSMEFRGCEINLIGGLWEGRSWEMTRGAKLGKGVLWKQLFLFSHKDDRLKKKNTVRGGRKLRSQLLWKRIFPA